MTTLSQSFLAVCPEEKINEAKEARKKVAEAEATIKKERTKRKVAFQREILAPQNKKWLEGKAGVGGVVSVFKQNLREKREAIKPFWAKYSKEVKEIFGFKYNQASKHVLVYEHKEALMQIFEPCFEEFPKNLDQLAKVAAEFLQSDEEEEKEEKEEPTTQQVVDFLKQMKQAQREKHKRAGQKRSRKVAELEEEVRQLKRRKVEQEKENEKLKQDSEELQALKQWLEEQNISPPLFGIED